MPLSLISVDHIHVYVPDISEALRWYQQMLNFTPNEKLRHWYDEGGPLTLCNGSVALALFERPDKGPGHTVAFRVNGSAFVEAMAHLQRQNIAFTGTDHRLTWSLYFSDPWGNPWEITTWDYHEVQNVLAARPVFT